MGDFVAGFKSIFGDMTPPALASPKSAASEPRIQEPLLFDDDDEEEHKQDRALTAEEERDVETVLTAFGGTSSDTKALSERLQEEMDLLESANIQAILEGEYEVGNIPFFASPLLIEPTSARSTA